MASAFAHAALGAALWPAFRTPYMPRNTWLLGGVFAVLPDADVLGFRLGIPYEAPLGHRGLSHSLFVAVLVGTAVAWLLARRGHASHRRVALAVYFSLALASHGVLDAMTTGGLGVAFFSPFDNARYFFAWRPIEVSPIGVQRFFTERGVAVLASEALWVGLPSLALAWIGWVFGRRARAGAQSV